MKILFVKAQRKNGIPYSWFVRKSDGARTYQFTDITGKTTSTPYPETYLPQYVRNYLQHHWPAPFGKEEEWNDDTYDTLIYR